MKQCPKCQAWISGIPALSGRDQWVYACSACQFLFDGAPEVVTIGQAMHLGH